VTAECVARNAALTAASPITITGGDSHGRYSHSDTRHTTLYISLVMLYTTYKRRRQNDFNAHG
jgi:hypothetical protein